MNCVDFFFENTRDLEKNFILGPREEVSFARLYEGHRKLALFLKRKIGTGKNIILISPNNSFFILAYLGILKSGNVCIPLNQAIEKSNLEFIQKETDNMLGFYANNVVQKLNPLGEVVNEDELRRIVDADIDVQEIDDLLFDAEQSAEIIYTSGSTARPKGVVLSHKNLVANTSSIVEYLQLDAKDIMEVVLPFFYCYGLSLLHTHLRAGGGIVLNNNFIFLGSVINDLKKYKCTGFAGVPSHFQILLRKSDTFKNSQFPDLRYVTQAGGKLHNVFIKEFRDSFENIDFYVMYGQTEATARLSFLPPEKLDQKFGSIGKGIPGVTLDVVDANGEMVLPGDVGEIVAIGDNVMKGYFKDQEATMQTIKDGKLFTGDLAYKDEDGYIFLTARKKEIIKVGGKRVSPKEIEEVIVSMEGVVDCSIEAVQDDLLGEAIKATVVLKSDGGGITEDSIKAFCGSKLAAFKVPSLIEFAANVNVNSAGKKVKKV